MEYDVGCSDLCFYLITNSIRPSKKTAWIQNRTQYIYINLWKRQRNTIWKFQMTKIKFWYYQRNRLIALHTSNEMANDGT